MLPFKSEQSHQTHLTARIVYIKSGTGDSGLFNLTIQDETTERTSSTFRAQMAFVSSSANKTVANKTYQNASVNGDLA